MNAKNQCALRQIIKFLLKLPYVVLLLLVIEAAYAQETTKGDTQATKEDCSNYINSLKIYASTTSIEKPKDDKSPNITVVTTNKQLGIIELEKLLDDKQCGKLISIDDTIKNKAGTLLKIKKYANSLAFTGNESKVEERLISCYSPGEHDVLASSGKDNVFTKIPGMKTIVKSVEDIAQPFDVGPAVLAPLLRYNAYSTPPDKNGVRRANHNVEFNPGVGVGIAFRHYPRSWIAPFDKLSEVKSDCRASTFNAKTLKEDPTQGMVAFYDFSITPAIFATKPNTQGDLIVQTAILVGFFRDLVSIGVGYNVTSPDRGKFSVLATAGVGFKF
jgi:hypothetical protein